FTVKLSELTEWRREFTQGRRTLKIETECLIHSDNRRFLHVPRADIEAFQATSEAAFDVEREEGARRNELSHEDMLEESSSAAKAFDTPPGADLVEAPLGGNIWKVHVRPGDRVERGAVIAAIEAMKTECAVPSPTTGT